MKKLFAALMATAMFSTALPAFAMDHGDMDMHDMDMPSMQHDNMHDHSAADCAKECDTLLKNCLQDVDSIQQQITKLKAHIEKDGADQPKLSELKLLRAKLTEANETLKNLSKPGH